MRTCLVVDDLRCSFLSRLGCGLLEQGNGEVFGLDS